MSQQLRKEIEGTALPITEPIPFDLALLELTKAGFLWADPKLFDNEFTGSSPSFHFDRLVPAVSVGYSDCTAKSRFAQQLEIFRNGLSLGIMTFFNNRQLKEGSREVSGADIDRLREKYPEVAEMAGLTEDFLASLREVED